MPVRELQCISKFDILINQGFPANLSVWGPIRVQNRGAKRGLWSVLRGGILGRAAWQPALKLSKMASGPATAHCDWWQPSRVCPTILPLASRDLLLGEASRRRKVIGTYQVGGWTRVTPMCENPSSVRSARLAAAGKEGVEIWLQDRGTEGFEHSCDKTGENPLHS